MPKSPTPPRARRSHAERTAETRARLIAAVVESIADVGFQRTTASEIAARAGVTWGAVQHHFGGKEGILVAVLEDSFGRFVERVGDLADLDLDLEDRVSRFVDGAFAHFSSAHYRSTFEILLNALGPEQEAQRPEWQTEIFSAWHRVWERVFGETGVSRRRLVLLERYTFAVLSGLAATDLLGWPASHPRRRELDLLKETLVRELRSRNGDTRAGS